MKFGFSAFLLLAAAWLGAAELGFAQSNYQFRTPASEINGFVLPAPAGPDGNFFVDDNWFDATLQNRFIPAYNIGAGERAFIENGGTAFVNTVGSVQPGQIAIGSAGSTTGTLEVQAGGLIEARVGTSVNGNITVGSVGGTGTLRILPGGTAMAASSIVEGSNANNLIRIGGLTGVTATLSGASASLGSKVQVFPNAAFSTTGSASLLSTASFTSEVTGNGTHGKFNVGTTATLGGSLALNFNSYNPTVGHNWNVIEASAYSGDFSSITSNATLASNLALVVTKPTVSPGRVAYNVSVQEVLVLEVNRDTGIATLKHPGSSSIQLDGYFIGSDNGALVASNWNSFDDGNLFGGDWIEAGPTANNLAELKPVGNSSLAGGNTLNHNFGAVFDATAGPFGQDNEDLEFEYRRSTDGAKFPGKVIYTGSKLNTLALQVDPTGTGIAYLRNTTDTTVSIDSYDVLSTAGSLTTTGWNSFDEQNLAGADTWLQVASNANQIGEVNQTGFLELAPGAALPLGPLFTGGVKDLSFSFLLQGQGAASTGKVVYSAYNPSQPVAGDFNGNGVVDAADYTLWRDNLGAATEAAIGFRGDGGTISASDYTYWKARFGNTSGSGAGALGSAAVPEPATWLLATVAVCGWVVRRRRN